MPRISKRHVLVEDEELEPYKSLIQLDEEVTNETNQKKIKNKYADSSSSESE